MPTSVLCIADTPERARALGRVAFSFGLSPVYAPDDPAEQEATAQLVLQAGGTVWVLGVQAPAGAEDVVSFTWDQGEQQPVRQKLG